MIPRYSRAAMSAIWSDENKYRIWQEIEICAAEVMAEDNIIPKDAAKTIRAKADFDIGRIAEIETETHHDVIAFLTSMKEFIGDEARFLHQGMTSSDVLDTGFAIQLTQAADILDQDLQKLLVALKDQAFKHKLTPMIGRSHGIYAEPITFGLKMASFYAEFARNRNRLKLARDEIAICAISGAVGTYAHLSPAIEKRIADRLHLMPETVSTQIIPRDRHAMFFATLGVIASSIERLAVEIRHLQRSEVREAQEYFAKGQKGSSAMPHKRNPILSENLTGIARIVRMAVIPAMENIALWHERDISHSAVERVIAPDTTIALDFGLTRLTGMIEKLVVHADTMQANIDKSFGIFNSQRILLALTQSGMAREQAYMITQKAAMEAWDSGTDFAQIIKQTDDITACLDEETITKLLDIKQHFSHIEAIFNNVFDKT